MSCGVCTPSSLSIDPSTEFRVGLYSVADRLPLEIFGWFVSVFSLTPQSDLAFGFAPRSDPVFGFVGQSDLAVGFAHC